jgi:hypothetical protein
MDEGGKALIAYVAGAYSFTYAFHIPIVLAGLHYKCVSGEDKPGLICVQLYKNIRQQKCRTAYWLAFHVMKEMPYILINERSNAVSCAMRADKNSKKPPISF